VPLDRGATVSTTRAATEREGVDWRLGLVAAAAFVLLIGALGLRLRSDSGGPTPANGPSADEGGQFTLPTSVARLLQGGPALFDETTFPSNIHTVYLHVPDDPFSSPFAAIKVETGAGQNAVTGSDPRITIAGRSGAVVVRDDLLLLSYVDAQDTQFSMTSRGLTTDAAVALLASVSISPGGAVEVGAPPAGTVVVPGRTKTVDAWDASARYQLNGSAATVDLGAASDDPGKTEWLLVGIVQVNNGSIGPITVRGHRGLVSVQTHGTSPLGDYAVVWREPEHGLVGYAAMKATTREELEATLNAVNITDRQSWSDAVPQCTERRSNGTGVLGTGATVPSVADACA
jgi:hypothetical protein